MVGRAYELETQIPYAPFADACEPVLATFDGSVLTRLTRGDRSVLTTLAPSLAGNSTVDVRSDVSSAAEQHVRLHTGILQLLRELAKKQPLLLVLENMQWADVSTIELFHFLARQVEGHRILLVGTWNETERELPDALRTMVRSLRQLNAASDVRLDPLSLEAVGQLVAQRFDVDAPTISGFVSALHDATRGNPFFVEQVLAELIARGTLARSAVRGWVGTWNSSSCRIPCTTS
jgi:predicted ATPase